MANYTVAELIKALQATPNLNAQVISTPAIFAGATTAATASVAATAHGLSVGDRVMCASITTTTGLAAGDVFFVKTVTDANNVILSTSRGGAAASWTTNGTGVFVRADLQAPSFASAVSGGIDQATNDSGTVDVSG